MQQTRKRCQIAARRAPFAVWPQRTSHIVPVVDQQVNGHHVVQLRAKGVQAERLNRFAVKPGHAARKVLDSMVNQGNLG